MENTRKIRQDPFTQRENEFLLNSARIKEYYQCSKKKEKLEIATLIAHEMKKSGISRDCEEVVKRLDNLKNSYRILKKQEESYFEIKWQYYEKMKKILE